MGRSITEGLYLSPLTRNGPKERVDVDDVKDLEDDAVLFSIRGEAPEGWYNAGTKKHAVKGSGYQDHQIFKKLPTAEAAPAEPKEKKEKKKEPKTPDTSNTTDVASSQEITSAQERVKAYDQTRGSGAYEIFGSQSGTENHSYGQRKASFMDRDPGFQAPQQSSVSTSGNNQAQSFMQGKLNKTKNQFNFQPTLK